MCHSGSCLAALGSAHVAQATHHRFTFDEYARFEADSGVKHEFHAGQVFAMSGGTPEHAGVTASNHCGRSSSSLTTGARSRS